MNQQVIEQHQIMLNKLSKITKNALSKKDYVLSEVDKKLVRKFFRERTLVVRIDETDVYFDLTRLFPEIHKSIKVKIYR